MISLLVLYQKKVKIIKVGIYFILVVNKSHQWSENFLT